MVKIKRFVIKYPLIFGLLLVSLYAVLGTLTFPIHYLFPDTEIGQLYGDTVAKCVMFGIFLLLLRGFGWVRISGLTRFGDHSIWVIVIVIFIYKVSLEIYAFTGEFSWMVTGQELSFATLIYFFPASLVEETMYRALLLIAMLSAWGSTKKGVFKAVLLSSSLFGLTHLLNLITEPSLAVVFQAVIVTLPGIMYAALLVKGKSLWPVIIIHWLSNAAVNIKIAQNPDFQETFSMWLIFGVVLLPLVVYSYFIIRRLPETYISDYIQGTDSEKEQEQ